MTDRLRRAIWIFAFFLLCSAGTMLSAWRMRDWHNGLAPIDAYSEANALREVDGFRAQGIGHDAGLGNVLYGGRYPEAGFAASAQDRADSVNRDGVYTHYPPGPEYLLYLAEAIFGPDPVFRLRILPLLLCGGCAVFLGFSIRSRFGSAAGWLVMSACFAMAPFSDANSSIHFQGYALALLLLEIGIALRRGKSLIPFLVLGFLQGWLSFDYVFLVVFAPLGIALALPQIENHEPVDVRLAYGRCIMAFAGFTAAHTLHFAQLCYYYGSFHQALGDMHRSASFRSGASQSENIMGYLKRVLLISLYYIVSPYPVSLPFFYPSSAFPKAAYAFRFLGLTFGVWWPIITLALWSRAIVQRHANSSHERLLAPWLKVSGIGLAVSSTWWFAMVNHATVHAHFLYRQLFFCFFLCVLFLSVRAVKAATGASWLHSQSNGPSHHAPPAIR